MSVDQRRLMNLMAACDLDEQESGTTIVRSKTLKTILTELIELRDAGAHPKSPSKGRPPGVVLPQPDDICVACKKTRAEHEGPNKPRHVFVLRTKKYLTDDKADDDICANCKRWRFQHDGRKTACSSFQKRLDPATALEVFGPKITTQFSHADDRCDLAGCTWTRQEHRLRDSDHEFVERPEQQAEHRAKYLGERTGDAFADMQEALYKRDEEIEQLKAEVAKLQFEIRFDTNRLTGKDVEWVVNDIGELGVKIGQRFFFLYKGTTIVYNTAVEEAENGYGPMKWRPVAKREFGEVVKPNAEHWNHPKAKNAEGKYVLPLIDENGPLPDGGWQLMPLQPEDDTHLQHRETSDYDICAKCDRRRWQHRTRDNMCGFELLVTKAKG